MKYENTRYEQVNQLVKERIFKHEMKNRYKNEMFCPLTFTPSTNLKDAWKVIEFLNVNGAKVYIKQTTTKTTNSTSIKKTEIYGDSLPYTISKAFLEAVKESS